MFKRIFKPKKTHIEKSASSSALSDKGIRISPLERTLESLVISYGIQECEKALKRVRDRDTNSSSEKQNNNNNNNNLQRKNKTTIPTSALSVPNLQTFTAVETTNQTETQDDSYENENGFNYKSIDITSSTAVSIVETNNNVSSSSSSSNCMPKESATSIISPSVLTHPASTKQTHKNDDIPDVNQHKIQDEITSTTQNQTLLTEATTMSMISQILEGSFDGTFLTDGNGQIQRVNQAAVAMFGYNSASELVGKNISMVIGGNAGHRHSGYFKDQNLQSRLDSIVDKMRDVTAQRADGSEFPVQVGVRIINQGSNNKENDSSNRMFVAYCHDLTEHKRAFAELEREKDRKLMLVSQVLEGSFDGTFLTDGDGQIQRVNEAAVSMFGYDSASDLVGKNISTVIGGNAGNRHASYFKDQNLQSRLESIVDKMRDVTAQRADGSEFPVQVGVRIINQGSNNKENDSSNRMFVAYCHDLTEHKRAFAELEREKDNKLMLVSQVLEGSFDGTFLTDGDGQIQRVNEAAVSMFGYDSASDLVGKNISMVIGGNAGHRHSSYFKDQNLQSRLESIVDKMRDVTAQRADGSEFPVQVGVRIINQGSHNKENDSSNRMFVAYCHDLTEHKRAFAELEREKDSKLMLVSQVLEGSFDGTFLTDGDGQIQRVNEAAVTMFGYNAASDLVGKNISTVIGGNAGNRHASYFKDRNLQSRLDSIVDKMRDVTAQRADGSEFPVQVGVRIINQGSNNKEKDSSNRMFVAYCHDLTEHKRAFAELEREKDSKLMLVSQVLEGSFDGTFLTDGDGQIQRVNEAAVSMFGYDSASDLVGKNISMVIGGNAGHRHASYFKDQNLQSRLESIVDKMRDVTAQRADGSEFPVQVGVRIINQGSNKNNNSKNNGSNDGRMFVAYCHDLTEHKRAFAELEREKDSKLMLVSQVLEGSFDGTFLTDGDGKIQRVNQAAVTMFGYHSASDLLGKNISVVIGGNAGHKHASYFKDKNLQARLDKIFEKMRDVTARRADGSEFPVQVGVRIINNQGININNNNIDGSNDGRMFVAYCHDLTDHKRAFAELEAERDKIVKAKQLRDSMFDSSFDCILLTDKKGTLLQVNQSTLDQFGYENASDLVGKNVSMLVGGGYAKKHDGYLKRFHDRGAQSASLGSLRYVSAKRKDGSEFPCQIGIRSIGSNKEGDDSNGLMVAYLRNMTREVERIGLEAEKMAAEKLLLNILPHEVAARLKEDPTHIADHHTTATMLFADIVGFTSMSSKMTPGALVALLNDIFSRFDQALDRYGLNKIKTIGDCYMVTSIPGNLNPSKACAAICHFAMDLIDIISEYSEDHPDRPLNMRIGINAGPVVAGVVGTKRFMYDIWGPAVNLASRMESTGVPGKIQVSKEVLDIIPEEEGFVFKHRGMVDVKGIGEMETFFLEGREESKAQGYWKGIKERLKDGTLHNLYIRRTSV